MIQPISGLYQLIFRARAGAKWTLANDDTPEGRRSADRMDEEADAAEAHARSNEDLITATEMIIAELSAHSHPSPSRTLAMRDLEMASMRLRRELGDKPSD
jgi:hypothetical protein